MFDVEWELIHQESDWGLTPCSHFIQSLAEQPTSFVGKRVLDLGCGNGANALALAKFGGKIVAVDASPTAINKLRTSVIPDLDITPIWADVTDFTPDREAFDYIIFISLLECLEQKEAVAVVQAMRSGLKSTGQMFAKILCEPCDHSLLRGKVRLVDKDDLAQMFDGYTYNAAKIICQTGDGKDLSYFCVWANPQ